MRVISLSSSLKLNRNIEKGEASEQVYWLSHLILEYKQKNVEIPYWTPSNSLTLSTTHSYQQLRIGISPAKWQFNDSKKNTVIDISNGKIIQIEGEFNQPEPFPLFQQISIQASQEPRPFLQIRSRMRASAHQWRL